MRIPLVIVSEFDLVCMYAAPKDHHTANTENDMKNTPMLNL